MKHPSKDELAAAAMAPDESPERAALAEHAESCAACGTEWRRATRLAELMGTLAAPPPPSVKSLARTQARVRALLASEPVSASPDAAPSASAGLAVAAAVLVSVVAALALTGPAISVPRVLLAMTTIGVAVLLPSFAMRSERSAVVASLAALALSVTLAWLDFTEFRLVPGHAVGCMQMELAVGALPLLAMVAMARTSGPRLGGLRSAAAGACGALAGQGVLLTTCAADASVMHVLVFHVAGVAIATVVGGGLGMMVARR